MQLDVEGQVTQRSGLDALETRHPTLVGTIRDPATQRRRALGAAVHLRGGPVSRTARRPLPAASGAAPLLVVAMAGG